MKEKLKILVVDDNKLVADQISDGLEGYFSDPKCSVSLAFSGKEALEAIRQEPPAIVLLDYYLPDFNGDEVLKIIKNDFPSTGVVVVSTADSAEIAVKLMKLGADDYVTKKFGFGGIGIAVEKVLKKKEMEKEVSRLMKKLDEEIVNRENELERKVEVATKNLKERNEKIAKILEVGKVMSTQGYLDKLLTTIIHEISNILGAERSSLFLYDEKTEELWLKISEDVEAGDIRFHASKGIAGYVARTRKVINTKDVSRDEFFNPEFDLKTGFETKNLLCAPMENLQGKLMGVVQVLNKQSSVFNEEDQEVLVMFASLAGVFIENSILAEGNIKKERLATVGKMAATIIHDIKNPMATIRGFVELLSVQSSEDEKIIHIIIKSMNRLMSMSEEILDYSKGMETTVEFERVNCMVFFNDIIFFLGKDLQERKIEFIHNIKYAGDLEINPDKIQRAIYNIAGNAMEAMEDGGRFTMDVSESEDKKSVILSFADTGMGMSPKVQKLLFEPFFTLGKRTGTGLGMSIVKKLVEVHRGTIAVDSEEGRGTKFEIVLPINQKTG